MIRVAPAAGGPRLGPAARAVLAAEIAAAYVRARGALRRDGLRDAVERLRAGECRTAPIADPVGTGRRLGRIVARTLAALPGDGRCLSQSLVLTRLLAARGVETRLVIAVRPGEAFAAHAWVEYDGVPLLPPGTDSFEELLKL